MRKTIKKAMAMLLVLSLCVSFAMPVLAQESADSIVQSLITEGDALENEESNTSADSSAESSAPDSSVSSEVSSAVSESSSESLSSCESVSESQSVSQAVSESTAAENVASSTSASEADTALKEEATTQESASASTAGAESTVQAVEEETAVENGSTEKAEPAASDIRAQGTCGENLTWVLTTDNVLTISGTGPMYEFRSSYEEDDGRPVNPWERLYWSINSIIIEEGCTTISKGAFSGFSAKIVDLPESLQRIETEAFVYCKLESIEIPNGVTYLGNSAFGYNRSLTDVTIGSGVSQIGEMAFDFCESLASIIVHPDNQYYQMVNGNLLMTKDGKTLLLYAKGSQEECNIPNGVERIENAAFRGADKLVSVTFPSTLKEIGSNAFRDCIKLARADLPEGLQTVGDSAFAHCTELTYAYLGANVKDLQHFAFYGARKLETIELSPNNPYYRMENKAILTKRSEADGDVIIQYTPGSTETSYTAPNTVTAVAYGAFATSANLQNVSLPSHVDKIETSAFDGMNSLQSVSTLGKVKELSPFLFYDTPKLQKVTIPNTVTSIEWAAFKSSGIQEVSIPNTVTTIGSEAFESSKLQQLRLPNSVTTIQDNAFCAMQLETIVIPASVKVIETRAFALSKLKSIVIPRNVVEYGDSLFIGCRELTDVTIYADVDVVPSNTFTLCESLKTVTFGAPLTKISSGAFSSGNPLETVNYVGSEESWNSIVIENYNDVLKSATIVFNWKPEGIISDIYDIQGNLVFGVQEEATVEQMKNSFISGAEIVVLNSDGEDVTNDLNVTIGTGCKIGTTDSDPGNEDSWKVIVVYGDLTGEGKISAQDFVQIRRYILGFDQILEDPECYLKAATPVSKDSQEPKTVDLLQMRRYLLGMETSMTP